MRQIRRFTVFFNKYFLIIQLNQKKPSKTNKNRLNFNFIYKVVYSYHSHKKSVLKQPLNKSKTICFNYDNFEPRKHRYLGEN